MFSFRKLSEKIKVEYREEEWQTNLLSILTAMFSYDGLPNTVLPEFVEAYLNVYGECAIWNTKGGFAVTYCNRAGSPNVNGLGIDLICTTENGQSVTFRDFENPKSPDFGKVVYIKNDKFGNPDYNYMPTAEILTDIDKSIKHIVNNSRYTPIAIAKDEKTKIAVQSALDANNNGKIQVVMSNNILDGEENAYVLNITDVTASDKIQYLYKAKDDTLRQFYQLYGMEACGSAKLAQQTVAEVNQGCNSHMILPDDRLAEREKGMMMCKAFFGWDCKVEFSEAWKREKGIFVDENLKEGEKIEEAI